MGKRKRIARYSGIGLERGKDWETQHPRKALVVDRRGEDRMAITPGDIRRGLILRSGRARKQETDNIIRGPQGISNYSGACEAGSN